LTRRALLGAPVHQWVSGNLRQWEKEREESTARVRMPKDRVATGDVSVACLLNATFLISDPELLIFIFARLLNGSNLVSLGGASADE
jgi:hypothetical protein